MTLTTRQLVPQYLAHWFLKDDILTRTLLPAEVDLLVSTAISVRPASSKAFRRAEAVSNAPACMTEDTIKLMRHSQEAESRTT